MKLPCVLILIAFGTVEAEAASIAAHRAVYDLKLVSKGEGANLASVDGRMVFEVQGSACEGWSVSFRMVNQYTPTDGTSKLIDTQSTSYESGDGLEMHYNEKEFVDKQKSSESRIKVTRPAAGATGTGFDEAVEGKSFDVPGDALFPMQHQLRLMDEAARGAARDASFVYDGSDGDRVFRAITFIGRRKEPGQNQRDIANDRAAALSGLPSWPVSISYYPANGGEPDTPSYQVGFDLYENGVATGLRLDYGEFALGGELASLELLGGQACP